MNNPSSIQPSTGQSFKDQVKGIGTGLMDLFKKIPEQATALANDISVTTKNLVSNTSTTQAPPAIAPLAPSTAPTNGGRHIRGKKHKSKRNSRKSKKLKSKKNKSKRNIKSKKYKNN